MDTRKDLYAFAMEGKEHSPAISDRASERIDAFRAAVLREAADALDALPADASVFDQAEHKYNGGAAAEKLRSLADERPEPSDG